MERDAGARKRKGRSPSWQGGGRWTAREARKALVAWQGSGKTMAAFCRDHGLRPKRLYWWRHQLGGWCGTGPTQGQGEARSREDALSGGTLVEAEVPRVSTKALTIALPCGARIEVADPEAVHPTWLAQLARGLGQASTG